MDLFVGTSGYSYREWKGEFYPEKLPQKQMLNFYAQQFSTVEINASFRKLPSASVVQAWAKETPDTFQFTFKAPQTITHFKRLKDTDDALKELMQTVKKLKDRQGPILFQLPPNFKKDVARLDSFLRSLGKRTPATFEFRHESWFDDEVYDCLRKHNCPLCAADAEDTPPVQLVATADWGYVRLRRENYTDPALHKWIKALRNQGWIKAYVYFKHEDTGTGPRLASRFLKLAGI
jgi:uncharacterized protein YecE (DUF72 family)